jgi:hypothetical protein
MAGDKMIFKIFDNGAGIYAATTQEKNKDGRYAGEDGTGLKTLRDDLENINGKYRLQKAGENSRRMPEGTVATIEIPLTSLEIKKSRIRQNIPSEVFSPAVANTGGIDFNAKNMNVKTSGEKMDFTLPENMTVENLMNAEGFVPVIINIVPITDFYGLLGLSKENIGGDKAQGAGSDGLSKAKEVEEVGVGT